MSAWRFILASLRHYQRIHVAVALGVAVATAVLTGALLVGDSMRGSLRDLTLERLGRIDSVLVAGHMFRQALAPELANDAEFKKHFTSAAPAMLLSGTLESSDGKRRATQANVVGTGAGFWSLGDGVRPPQLKDREVLITEPLAAELNAKPGDEVILRIPIVKVTPGDSVLGDKDVDKSSESIRLKIAAVLPTEGLSRFGITPSQQLPRNVFLPLDTLQDVLKQPGKANAILVSTNDTLQSSDDEAQKVLSKSLRPKLDDYGVKIEGLNHPPVTLQFSADSLVLPDEVVQAFQKAFDERSFEPVVTYLANSISAGAGADQRKIPYSIITGMDHVPGGPTKLADDEIVLNRWAADDLKVKVGDPITVTYYEPESTHGKLLEQSAPPLKLRAIVELETADGKPAPAADPKLTPELPGVTDQKSISDWALPFELVEKIRQQDEEYWEEYSTTPKAFVSLSTAKHLWASRWGTISLIRLPADGFFRTDGVIRRDIELSSSDFREPVTNTSYYLEQSISPSAMGMTFLPVKAQGLAASAGTTPFEALFLGFSFFLIAAAVMLVALLFQLGIEQRARELGTLEAVGVGRRRITRLWAREGSVVAVAGATVGVIGGILYAWLMVFGLRTWWLAAISTPFLRLHVSWLSLLIGWVTGVVVSWLTIRWSIRKLVRRPVARLLAGSVGAEQPRTKHGRPWWPVIRVALAILVVLLSVVGFFLKGESQAGSFFGSGAMMLVLLLGEIRYRLRDLGRQRYSRRSLSLVELSALNTARNPGRSTLTIGLVAAASFLIVAVSAFRLNTGVGGTGDFDLVATSDLPIHFDLNTPEGRRELGFGDADNKRMEQWGLYPFRVAAGENASCLNLYQPTQPRVLGVPESLVDRDGFAWAAEGSDADSKHWAMLNKPMSADSDGHAIVPVVMDMSTAIYSLHLKGVGAQFTIRDATDRPVTCEIVGLLDNSVLQGNVLMSEANFLKLFPDVAGYRFFLVDNLKRRNQQTAGANETVDDPQSMAALLEAALAEEGFDARDAREELAQFLAVQNTYLSTFQSLGALGLLLGTIGLAIVQLRSVLERRAELALMRAEGFNRRRLARMVVWENAVLLVGGLLVGCASAAVALIPQWGPQAASVPWLALLLLLGTIAAAGLLAGWLATRSALRAPIVGALRGD